MPFIMEVNDDGPGFGPDLRELARVVRFIADTLERSADSARNTTGTKTLTAIIRDPDDTRDIAVWLYSKTPGPFGLVELVKHVNENTTGTPFTLRERTEGGNDAEGGKE